MDYESYQNEYKKKIIQMLENKYMDNKIQYNQTTENAIQKLIKGGMAFRDIEWQQFLGRFQDNPYVLYAMVMHKNVPQYIVNDIVSDIIDDKKFKGTILRNDILFKSLYHDISQRNVIGIWNEMGTGIFLRLNGFSHKSNPTDKETYPFAENTTQLLCCFAMRSKKNRNFDINCLPFYFLKDENFAEKILDKKKCDEITRTAIASNPFLPDRIRNKAYENGIDPLHTIHFTEHMINDLYSIAAETYTEMPLNPYTKLRKTSTKEELSAYNTAKKFLCKVLYNRELPESMEIDLFNRLQKININNSHDEVLFYLLQNTQSSKVLKGIYHFRFNSNTEVAFQNPYMPKSILKQRMEELAKQVRKMKKLPSTNDKYRTFMYGIKNIALENDDYPNIIKYAPIAQLDEICGSIYMPKLYLNQVSENALSNIKQTDEIYQSYIEQRIDLIYKCTLNEILKDVFSSTDDFEKFCDMVRASMRIYYPEKEEKIDRRGYCSVSALMNGLEELTEEQKGTVVKIIEEKKKEYTGIQKEFLQTLSEKIKLASCISDHIQKKDYSIFKTDILKHMFDDALYFFGEKYKNDPLGFYMEIDSFAKETMPLLEEIESQRELEMEEEIPLF